MSDDVAPATPEDAVLALLSARDAMQYERVVSLVDMDSLLERFRRHCAAMRPYTLERFAEDHPEMTPEELPTQFEHFRRVAADPMTGVADLFPGVRTHAEFEALDPRYYLRRNLERFDMRVDLVRRLRARGRPVPPELMSASPHKGYDVLGSVSEEPDLTHVLYREVWRPDNASESKSGVEIMSTRRQADGTWRLLADDPYFLQHRGSFVSYIPDEYADLYEEDMMARHDEELAKLRARQSE